MDDAEERLRDNLDGLDWLVPQLQGVAPGRAAAHSGAAGARRPSEVGNSHTGQGDCHLAPRSTARDPTRNTI